jgi:hypothetical protein
VLVQHDKEEAMHTMLSTNVTRRIVGTCASLVVAGTLVQSAFAGGEPKNQPPFTRPVGERTTQAANGTLSVASSIRGEAKNEYPFTRIVSASSSGSDVNWTDAVLGGLVGVSICIAGVGGTLLTRRGVPRTA